MEDTMRSTRWNWLTPAALVALSAVPAVMGTLRLDELASGAAVTAENARFHAAPLPVVLHILAAIPFSILGALQFSPALRRRAWHRAAGRLLAPCGLLAALTGLWMTLFYPWPAGDGRVVYLERLLFGSAMLACLVLALHAVRRRDFAAHGAWMTRAYAIGLGAGTQVLTHLPWLVLAEEKPGELARAVMMGAAWAINVVVAEWAIRRGSEPRRGAGRPRPFQPSSGAASARTAPASRRTPAGTVA
jgi:uncharacterized membrane protein